MRTFMRWLGGIPGSGINRIALSTALRATLATGVPLAVLPHFELGRTAYPAVLGALATSMVDVGGPYRTRLLTLLAQASGGPCLLMLATVAATQEQTNLPAWGSDQALQRILFLHHPSFLHPRSRCPPGYCPHRGCARNPRR
jgi:hypothetical protein